MAIFTWLRLIFLVIATRVSAISSPWRPLTPVRPSIGVLQQEAIAYDDLSVASPYDLDAQEISLPQEQSRCSLYKISMNQQFYFEYIHYKIDLPNIKEFTLCMWTKFHNHTNDHPLFSYAVADQPRGILSWVANTARSSYYMMNVDGHNLYRLNYPLRLNKWYHSCQSWNGRTGEWQIWVNDERVGRGFNNRLVGHVIKGGGIAISGQEQRQLGGGFLEGEAAPPGAGGMLGELTMVQLYNVALSAGKAHRNHKHHHAHHYEHDTSNNTPRPTSRPSVTGPPLPQSPFLTAGQINPQVKLNPGAPLQIVQNGVILRHPGLPVPKGTPAQSFSPGNSDVLSTVFPLAVSRPALSDSQIFVSPLDQRLPTGTTIDAPYRSLFKREKKNSDDSSAVGEESGDSRDSEKSIGKRQTDSRTSGVVGSTDGKVTFVAKEKDESRTSGEKVLEKRDSEKKKRGLYQFSNGLLVDDGYAVPQGLDSEYFPGLTSYSDQLSKHEDQEDESEPAEAEVKQIMDICDGCAPEPFEKALVMGWRSVPKKVYSGALYLPAAQICKAF